MRTTSETEKAAAAGTATTLDTAHVADYTVSQADKLTVLETIGPCLTKVFKSDGATDSYDDAASFHYKVVEVSDIHALSRLLAKLHANKKRCLIRGTPKGAGMEPGAYEGTVTRTNANFTDQPLHWFMCDIDKYRPGFADPVLEPEQAVLDYLDECLPAAFKTASFYWHLSSSAGTPGNEGVLKMHLHFWSKTPYTTAQMAAWVKTTAPTIDRAIFRRVQIHFVADPIFEPGRVDPVPVRCGFHQGETDHVDLVIDGETLAKARDQGAGEGGNDMVLKDPADKDGLIGAFHKAFTAEDVLLQFLDDFEQVTERRYSWSGGGGTPEGVWVHDDGQHIGSSHNTWPIDGIANLWDVVRVFKFGDLDHRDGEAEGFETLGEFQVGSRPSDLAMKAWAAELPELKEAQQAEELKESESRAEIVAGLLQQIVAAESQGQLSTTVLSAIKAAMAEHDFSAIELAELKNTFSKKSTALSPSKAKLDAKSLRDIFSPEQEEATLIFDLEMSLVKQVLDDWFGAGKHLKFFGGCWWIYRHGVWQQTEASLVENRVQRTIQKILAGGNKDTRKLTKLLRDSERGDYLNALTSAVFGNLRRHCSKDDQVSDPLNLMGRDPGSVVNCRNGELWFDDDGNVDFVHHDPSHKLTHQIAVDYDPEADCPKFKAALALAFCKCSQPGEVTRHFLELMGTIIQPRRIEAMWVLLKGRGENGKTFLVDIIEAVMGSDACLKGRVSDAAAGKDSHFTASLIGKLAFIDDDVKQGALLPDDWLKKLSEEKTLTANPKNAHTFQFVSRATMVMLANHWPRTVDTSHGMTRRAHVFEFKHQLTADEKDPGLKRYIISNELPGVLNLLIDGWQRVLRRGRCLRPDEVVAAGDSWMRSANTTGNFFRQMLVTNPKAPALKLTIIEQFYHSWMADHEPQAKPLGKQAFIAALQNMGVEIFTQHNQMHARGVTVNPVPGDDVPADYVADGVAEEAAEKEALELFAKTFGTNHSIGQGLAVGDKGSPDADQDFAE